MANRLNLSADELTELLAEEFTLPCTAIIRTKSPQIEIQGKGTVICDSSGKLVAPISDLQTREFNMDPNPLVNILRGKPADFKRETRLVQNALNFNPIDFILDFGAGSIRSLSPSGYSPIIKYQSGRLLLGIQIESVDWAYEVNRHVVPARFYCLALDGVTKHISSEPSGLQLPVNSGFRSCEFAHSLGSSYLLQSPDPIPSGEYATLVLFPYEQLEMDRMAITSRLRLLELLPALSLIFGDLIGLRFIDVRSRKFSLLARIPCYERSKPRSYVQPLITTEQGSNLSDCLSQFLDSRFLDTEPNRLAVRHILASHTESLFVEDIFYHLAQAVEAMARKFNVKGEQIWTNEEKQDLRSMFTISKCLKREIAKLSRSVSSPATKAKLVRSLEVSGVRRRRQPSFADKVGALISSAQLRDQEGVQEWLGGLNREDDKTWLTILSTMRTESHHGENFSEKLEITDCLRGHLEDLLVRFILLTIGYRGLYYSRIGIEVRQAASITDLVITSQLEALYEELVRVRGGYPTFGFSLDISLDGPT